MIITPAACSLAVAMAMSPQPGDRDDQVIEDLKAQVTSLQHQVNGLRQSSNDGWLTERRAAEVRSIVQDVLADADTRASLLTQDATAGYDGKFFIGSADGAFRLNLGGHLQARYIYNARNDDGGGIDEDVAGFAVRRAKLKGNGHIGNPKIGFGFAIAGDSDSTSGDGHFEDYYAEYKYDNGVKVRVGRWKQPFARVNLTSSSKQLTVERSLVNETFNVDRSEGIMVSQTKDNFKWAAAFNDGIDAQNSDWDSNDVDFGLTGRVDFLLAGDWKAMDDFSAWNGQNDAAFLGAAIHYQEGESDGSTDGDELMLVTVDGSYESGSGLGLFAAFYYADVRDDSVDMEADNYGFEVSASYMIDDKWEPFVRYEYMDFDDDVMMVDNSIALVTLGINCYQAKHNSKFTADVVFGLDHISEQSDNLTLLDPSASLGLLDDDGTEDGQVAVRLQYQLAF